MKEITDHIQKLTVYNSALVEAGHFYADRPVEAEQQSGVKIGMAVVHTFEKMGLSVTPCLLIDDYNAVDIFSGKNVESMKNIGFHPEIIFKEKEYEVRALGLLEELKNKGKIKIKKSTGRIYLKKGFVELVKESGKPTCAILDAALYMHKHELCGGICVTVLPDLEKYKAQQNNTKSILKEAEKTVPILNVFFNEDGNVNLDFDF